MPQTNMNSTLVYATVSTDVSTRSVSTLTGVSASATEILSCFAPTSQITNQTERGKSLPPSISLPSNRLSRNKQYDYDVISLGNIFFNINLSSSVICSCHVDFCHLFCYLHFSTTTSGFFFFPLNWVLFGRGKSNETIIGNSNRYSDKTQMTKIPFRPRILNSVLAARALYALESACKRSGIVKR